MAGVDRTAVHAIVDRKIAELEHKLIEAMGAAIAELRDELERNVEAITLRIDKVHGEALRELTRIHAPERMER